jgi:hypothetical protein
MQVGLTDAAKLTGKDNSTITRAANKGRLSFTTDASGNRLFDVAELERVFGPLKSPDEEEPIAAAPDNGRLLATVERAHETEVLLLKEHIRLLQAQVDDLKADRERWQQQAGQITRLLTDERSVAERAREAEAAARERAARLEALAERPEAPQAVRHATEEEILAMHPPRTLFERIARALAAKHM